MIYVALYVMGIIGCNLAFDVMPLVSLGDLGAWPPASLIVGFLFVLRDYAQRAVGHKVIVAMLIGGALSYWLASPLVAMASLSAFLLSEFIDWAIYTWSRKPFRQRVLLSSAISTPIDSAAFLFLIGQFGWIAVALMTLSKMLGAVVASKMEGA